MSRREVLGAKPTTVGQAVRISGFPIDLNDARRLARRAADVPRLWRHYLNREGTAT